jgi:hypothetical protein
VPEENLSEIYGTHPFVNIKHLDGILDKKKTWRYETEWALLKWTSIEMSQESLGKVVV